MGKMWRILGAALMLFAVFPQPPAEAATTLTAEIVSWQIIGLDSNDINGSPEKFLVQVRITNTGSETATGVSATLVLGSPVDLGIGPIANPCGGACIALVSPATDTVADIPAGQSADAFWTVRVVRSLEAYETLTPITVTASAANAGTVTATQVNRQPPPCGAHETPGSTLLVEGLISQARNDVLSYSLTGGIQRPDGSWEVVLGSQFTVTVLAETTVDYPEISVPAITDPTGTITPISTDFTFSQGTPSDDDIYTLNAGGSVTANYRYDAAAIGTLTLSQLIYDCSGNSFHYNPDYLVDSMTIHVVAPPAPVITMTKSVSPATQVPPGTTLTYTISYANTGTGPATNFVITDVLDGFLQDPVPSSPGTYDPATRTLTWSLGTLAAGATGSVSFTAKVSHAAADGTVINNVGVARADGIDPISSPTISSVVDRRSVIPDTGTTSPVLALLGLASIGFGQTLATRRKLRLR